MAYKNKTNFYRIPSMGYGDVLTEQQEWIKDSIVDNLLYASTFGCDKCFLQQGKYHIQYYPQGRCSGLIIEPIAENGFSLMGMLNYRLFYSKEKILIGNFCYGRQYYVYLQFSEEMQINPTKFKISFYQDKQELTMNNMLLCYISTFNDEVKLFTDVNKVYAKNILAHTKDNTNPHGELLLQKDLYVVNELKLKGNEVNGSIYDSFITQNGQYIMNIPKNKNVIFVTAYPESLDAGNISWKIENNHIIFNNSGSSGIKVNVKFDVR